MYDPTPEQINAFKAAWHDADDNGQAGKRVEIALAKVLGPALASAWEDGWNEGWKQGMDDSDGHARQWAINPYKKGI